MPPAQAVDERLDVIARIEVQRLGTEDAGEDGATDVDRDQRGPSC